MPLECLRIHVIRMDLPKAPLPDGKTRKEVVDTAYKKQLVDIMLET